MSYDNQDYTIHQIHGFNPNCEWCADQRPKRKKTNYEEVGGKLRRMAHNMEKVGEIVEIMDQAKKNNPRGLIF